MFLFNLCGIKIQNSNLFIIIFRCSIFLSRKTSRVVGSVCFSSHLSSYRVRYRSQRDAPTNVLFYKNPQISEQYQTSPMKRNPKGTFVVTSNLYSVFPFELYICSSWLLLFCLNILDWMKRGSFCVFHLCTILMGQSGIVKVLVFFETFSM